VTLPELSIKRPVFATVMSLVLILVGLVSYERLSVREYPAIDPPVITVQTNYPGASAAIVETQVTKVLEDTLSGIEGIDFITSISRQESSQITVRFLLNRDPDIARDRHVREQADLLNHIPDRSPQTYRIPIARVLAFDQDVAGIRQHQPVHELQHRRLAGAAPADQRDDFSGFDRQREAVEDARAGRRGVGNVLKLDRGHDGAIGRIA
jgi:AcrB/AcrD/AcrF family